MLSEFESKIADFIEAHGLLGSASKILLAVSGGVDSIALLYVMQALKIHNVLRADLHCAHINHQLRAEQADKDEDFVMAQAAELKLTCTTKRISVSRFARENKLSIETAARKLRMKSLLDIARADSCSHIITGHQKDDNAETVIHRMLRGTGFRGLAGIWPARKFNENVWIARPMLCVRRNEIVKYLQEKKLSWCEDLTNANCRYTRNYIRHRLLPELQQDFNGSLVEQLSELSESARRFYKIVCNYADDIWPKVADCIGEKIILNVKLLAKEPQPVKVEIIRRSLVHIGCGESNVTQQHYQSILQLAQQNVTGKLIELPGGFIVRREYHDLIFSPWEETSAQGNMDNVDKSIELEIPGKTQFGQYFIEATKYLAPSFTGGSISKFIEYFDLDKIMPPLVVRFRQPGDKFVPLGQKGETKIGKFITAQKVPHDIRQRVLVITDSEKILWLWPVRIGEQAKITNETRKILQLKITQNVIS